MRVVWKFVLSDPSSTLRVGWDAKVVHVDAPPTQADYATVWVEHRLPPHGDLPEDLRLIVHGTGHRIADGLVHVGSTLSGNFVWHVYKEA